MGLADTDYGHDFLVWVANYTGRRDEWRIKSVLDEGERVVTWGGDAYEIGMGFEHRYVRARPDEFLNWPLHET